MLWKYTEWWTALNVPYLIFHFVGRDIVQYHEQPVSNFGGRTPRCQDDAAVLTIRVEIVSRKDLEVHSIMRHECLVTRSRIFELLDVRVPELFGVPGREDRKTMCLKLPGDKYIDVFVKIKLNENLIHGIFGTRQLQLVKLGNRH